MELRTASSPKDVKHYTTERLREEFLIQGLFAADEIKLVYSHIDRIITGTATPVGKKLELTAGEELRAEYFLQRRELGVINIGGAGKITIDGKVYEVAPREGMYVGLYEMRSCGAVSLSRAGGPYAAYPGPERRKARSGAR